MSRWVTFYYDMLREHVSDLNVHPDRETALKYFNQHCKGYFQLNTKFKANKLPASYGYPLRKYYGISAQAFRKEFEISVDEALQIAKGGQRVSQNTSKKELKSIKPEDYRRSFTKALCGDCKYADVPRNRKPCCSCEWLERENYYEEAEND